MIKRVLSTAARIATCRRYSQILLGTGSRVDFWKLHAESNNRIAVGAKSVLASQVVFEKPGAALDVGSRSFIGLGLMSIAEHVEIGDDVMISWGATIVDHHSHSMNANERACDVELWLTGEKHWAGVKIAPVRVENRAWLGFNVSLLPGVTVGEGAIIGACSLVTKDVPPWTVAVGNPARFLRELTSNERC